MSETIYFKSHEEYLEWKKKYDSRQIEMYMKNAYRDGDFITANGSYISQYELIKAKNNKIKLLNNGNTDSPNAVIYDKINHNLNKDELQNVVRKSINIETQSNDATTNRGDYFYDYFDRWYSVHPDYELVNLCHYVFMTKPDLNLITSSGTLTKVCENEPYFRMINHQSPHIMRSLCQSQAVKSATTFIPMLVSRTHALQIPDFSINSNNLSQPYSGYLLPYASHAIASTTGGEFDITFREFADLSIHKLFNTWLYYIDGVTRNKWTPKLEYIDNDYGIVCDYMVSVYDIICAPDASTILFMVKYTGCLPLTAPNSNLSFNLGGGGQDHDLSIPFKYFHCEVLNPEILSDFNINAGIDIFADNISYPTASPAVQNGIFDYCTSSGFVKRPFIVYNSNDKMYKLRWEAI